MRYPIGDEIPAMEALGERLLAMRRRAGASQALLATRAGLSVLTVARLEHARQRVRPATLRRLIAALVEMSPALGDVDTLTADLLEIAGPGVAPESRTQHRIERRRTRIADMSMRWRELRGLDRGPGAT